MGPGAAPSELVRSFADLCTLGERPRDDFCGTDLQAKDTKMGHFEPIHDAHAIEQMALIVQFVTPLDSDRLALALRVADAFKEELPGRADLQALTFGGVTRVPPIMGRSLSRTRPDGVTESELRVELSGISFRTTTYTRWDAIWERAQRYFNELMPFYLAVSGLSGISLNFQDRFYWSGAPSEMRAKFLFRPNSEYVAPHIYEASDLWHSYTGSFTKIDEFVKRLLNINIDCLDESPSGSDVRRVVAITTVVTDMLNQAGYSPLVEPGPDLMAFFQRQVPTLHAASKSKLLALINDRMCKRIGLEGSP
jgi:uncharacterized protein (TIGR04255 family)